MEEKFSNRRRNYFIKKEFQRNFIIKFCTLVVIGALISGAIIYFMSKSTVTTTFENSRLAIKSTADYILPAVLLSGAVVIVLIGLATIAITLFTSHKIAGPLYRMEKDVSEVARGNLAIRFNLRIGDELKPLAAGLDSMARALREDLAQAKDALHDLESVARPQDNQALKKLYILKEKLDKFKT